MENNINGTTTEKHSDYAIERIPDDKKRSWSQMLFVWLGWVFATTNLLSGGVAGNGLPLGKALLAILLGSGVLAAVGILQGIVGAKTGLSTYVLLRYSFGNKGSNIISFIFAFVFVGWFGVGVSLAAQAAYAIIPINITLLSFVFACLMLTTALFGFKGLDILSKFAVPFVVIISIWGIYIVTRDTSVSALLAVEPKEPLSFGQVAATVIGAWMSAAIVAPDISRYARTGKDAAISAGIAFIVGNSALMAVGAIFAVAIGEWDLIKVFTGLGMGTIALIFLIMIQWTTSDNNLYSASLGIANILKKNDKFKITLVLGVVGVFLATIGIYDHFITYLNFLGIVLPPVAGVAIIDAYLFSTKYKNPPEKITLDYSIPAFISLGIGMVVGFIFTYVIIWGSSAITALLVTAVVYFILNKYMGNKDNN